MRFTIFWQELVVGMIGWLYVSAIFGVAVWLAHREDA